MSRTARGARIDDARPVRVGIVLSDGLDARGGIGRVIGYLSRYFADHRPDISAGIFRARYSTRAVVKHLTIPAALIRFAIACRTLDVVHLNIAPRGSTWRKLAFARVARLARRPVLLHLHGSGYDAYFSGQTAGRQAAIRGFFQSADAVVVLSGYWRRFVQETLQVPADRVVEIANGVAAVEPSTQTRPPAPSPSIVFLGIVGERKGVDVLIDALAGIADLSWRATIAGDGEVEAARARAQAAGIGDRIAFPGWVDEAAVAGILAGADLFVLPSRAENQPVSILEAMARAVPVIATRIGGIPEQLGDGETGILVEPGDVPGLADAVGRLLRDPGRRAAIGHAGEARFRARYALSASADRFAALYHTLASRRR